MTALDVYMLGIFLSAVAISLWERRRFLRDEASR